MKVDVIGELKMGNGVLSLEGTTTKAAITQSSCAVMAAVQMGLTAKSGLED